VKKSWKISHGGPGKFLMGVLESPGFFVSKSGNPVVSKYLFVFLNICDT